METVSISLRYLRRWVEVIVPVLGEEALMDQDQTPVASFSYTIAPWLSVRNGGQAVEFYKLAFDAIEVFRLEAPDGGVVARLSVAGAEFWVSDESPAHGNFSPESLGGGTVRMVFTVPNPDAVVAQALAAGGFEVHPVIEEHGWRVGRVRDPFGHHWEIGRPLEAEAS
jgi:PhnB protein